MKIDVYIAFMLGHLLVPETYEQRDRRDVFSKLDEIWSVIVRLVGTSAAKRLCLWRTVAAGQFGVAGSLRG
jgi:hypothetical protein